MGCAASSQASHQPAQGSNAAPPIPHESLALVEAATVAAAAAPTDSAAATTLWLLERLLQRRAALPPLPVLPHDRRRPSGERGLSLAALEGIERFFGRHGGLEKVMGDVCKEESFAASVVALTRGSGLSLAETLELEGEAAGVDTSGIVGPASDFFSYSWTGTKLADMLGAIADAAPVLARGGETRLWVDMFAASQNLLAGAFRDEAHPKGSAGYAARKEDTDRIFDDALLSVRSVLLYCSPLVGEWDAPPHGFLSPEREQRGVEHPWRAWCLFEVTTALGAGHRLHVALSPADRASLRSLLEDHFDDIAHIFARLDAADAQITKVEDREYILPRVLALPAGFGTVTAIVNEALREWLARAAREELDRLPSGERGTSALINNLGMMLKNKGDLDGAEGLYRESLAASRETLGDRHPITLTSIKNLGMLLYAKGDVEGAEGLLRESLAASRETLGDRHPSTLASINNLGRLLKDKGDVDGAEGLYREALAASREALGDRHPDTLASINNLGMLLYAKGDVEGAEGLYREDLAACRETLGDRHPSTLASINNLGMVLLDKGDVEGAEGLLRESLAVKRETLGDRHPSTLASINNLGMLLKAKGDLEGAEGLYREALAALRETLGNRHPHTLASINNLGELLEEKGDLDGAEGLYREALAARRETLGDRHPDTLISIYNLGMLLKAKGDLDDAVACFAEELEGCADRYGTAHDETRSSARGLAELLDSMGKKEQAAALRKQYGL